jgi:hypothetical protein
MLQRNLLASFALFSIIAPTCLGATTSEKLRNAQVIVTEATLAPGEQAVLPQAHPSTLVFLSGNSAEFVAGNRKASNKSISRGLTLFEPAGAGSIKNAGTTDLSFVRVELLNAGSSDMWGMTGLAPAYKMIFENRYVRAYDIKIPAQGFEPQHTHHARVVVCLSGAELEHILPSGEKQPSALKTGEIAWRLAATHIGHNMGHTDLWVIAIEPK